MPPTVLLQLVGTLALGVAAVLGTLRQVGWARTRRRRVTVPASLPPAPCLTQCTCACARERNWEYAALQGKLNLSVVRAMLA